MSRGDRFVRSVRSVSVAVYRSLTECAHWPHTAAASLEHAALWRACLSKCVAP